MAKGQPMTNDDIKAIVRGEIELAISHASQQSADRQKALDVYMGRPYGDERPARSQVVTRETLDTIEWILPSLLRLFTTSDQMVRIDPVGPEDIEAAEQATDLCNIIWSKDNDGFLNLHHWFKDGLLNRIGVLKIWWQPEDRQQTLAFRDLTEDQVMMLMQDDTLEILSAEQHPGPEGMLSNVSLRRTIKAGKVMIEPLPPEEFLHLPTVKKVSDDGVGHKRKVPISDLKSAGYDPEVIDNLGSGDDDDDFGERAHRHEDDGFLDIDDSSVRDETMKKVTVVEWYTRLDRDRDGIAEKYKVTMAGDEILEIEEVDDNPFATVTPILMPHKLIGLSIPDIIADLQHIKSTLQRQMLDSLYLANNPRTWAIDNMVNLEDLTTNRPGGVVRVKGPGVVGEMNTTFVAGAAFPMLQYLDQTLEGRSGVSRTMQGLDVDALARGNVNQTATGVAVQQSAQQARIELIARIYAEGVKRAFKLILRNTIKYQDQPRMVRLRGKFVPIDPRTWNIDLDLSVEVGLGTGNKQEQMAYLGQVLNAQKEALGAGGLGLVKPKNIYNTLRKMIELAGLKNVDPYFSDPDAQQEQPKEEPKQDPQLAMIEMQQQVEIQKLQLAREKMIREDDRERDELEAEVALRAAEIQAKFGAQVNIAELRARVEMDREAMKQQAAMQQAQMAPPAPGPAEQPPMPMPQQQGPF